ncbi:NADH-quinone oxidoreductase subunit C [Streptomyces sp. LN549]|uniref:NADH-quinone oxidoreductase subunit C n=1 Tax=Streptomyces sp. LN549 TaxID=3112979 RepID=UPI00371519BB
MTAAEKYDRLPDAVTELFGEDATAERAYELLTVDVPAASWIDALETARDDLGCTYFDWLSAVDEPGTGFRVCAHVAALPAASGSVRRLLVRTTVPHEAAVLPTAIDVYAGAAWHERETHEMFGIAFEGHPHLVPLLLPEGFEGHPLRKDFVLAARVAKAWPGAKEPGESEHGGPKRRTMLPPGVPDPNEWGPLKGQLPPAPARPARAARPAGDRPARRTRSVSDGSAGQQPPTTSTPDTTPDTSAPATAPPEATGTGTGTESASRPTPARRTRSASQGSASQERPGTPAAPSEAPTPAPASDAPWHDARPAFDEPPVREGAARGEAPRSGTPDDPTPEPPTEQATETSEAPEPPEAPETSEDTKPPEPPEAPKPQTGGDPE